MTCFSIEDLADLSALSESEQVEFKWGSGRYFVPIPSATMDSIQ